MYGLNYYYFYKLNLFWLQPQLNMEEFRKNETLQSQPFVILKGCKATFQIQESFVMFERRIIKCHSLMQAVDVCFKLYFIFSLQFPNECLSAWTFLSHAIYGLEAGKRMTPTVSKFASEVVANNQ